MSADSYLWWQRGIIYQVYPRSFQDTNGDGVGDLAGIRSRLDYLQWLGVDAVWISPIFSSPMADFGYDISDYCGIHPVFGDLDEFDLLIKEAHARDLRVILDFVPNHTSDQHPWFVESRSSRDNPKRDWYLWRDPAPAGGGPPNNWRAMFGGSGWEWDETTQQYYYHGFLKEQPDLNWRNPDVQEAMLGALRFWLDRGVDGFRVDVVYHLIKDDQWRDNPPNPHFRADREPSYNALDPIYSTDRPEVHEIIRKMAKLLASYPGDRLMIGEVYLPVERLMTYYGPDGTGAHMPYNFQLILLPWEARAVDTAIDHYEAALPKGAWPNWVLGNHDQSRVASRIGREQARVAQMLLLTLRGTPTMYYGDEIAMKNVHVPPERIQDPFEKREPGKGNGRDPQRSPMQWSGTAANAGFCDDGVQSWLPMGENFASINVESEKSDPDSLLSLTRRLIDLRRAEPALSVGDHCHIHADGAVLAYCRRAGERRVIVTLNLSHEELVFDFPPDVTGATILLSTRLDREGERVTGAVTLRADEGLIMSELPRP